MLEHGGGLLRAAAEYGIPANDWLDLSTGVNPNGWPVPPLSADSWLRLPQNHDGLEAAAADYYGSDKLLAVAGSQPAIQLLPRLRAPCRVGMLALCYAEHPHHWQKRGHQLFRLSPDELAAGIDQLDVVLLCNPNNPTGDRFDAALLESWRQRLAARGGWLVVDEAFLDAAPEDSMLPHIGKPGLIVLRSIGKFFGLAGARAGFVFGWPELLQALAEELGPWTVAGPAREAVKLALRDVEWQRDMASKLQRDSSRLQRCLERHGLPPAGGSELFQWVPDAHSLATHRYLAGRGILTRYFESIPSLRFGLPKADADWVRLEQALGDWRRHAVGD
ncbi:threonine-phosphate decarboxylase CobD [Chromobacterium subtsugae]|uniref:threonine-phosphate decarboxylase CobD n=1 Tax=Chromobacterium subtsugae TaxID=251747 RepID=UPI00064125C0|nr:threonine-phosphate decarboxylase CobD [Chromobacterium subtsugae]